MSTTADQNGARGGYIRLYRSLLDNPVWTRLSPAVLKVMIACLLQANWKPGEWCYGGRSQVIPRGSFVTSYPKLAKFCRLTPKQIRGALHSLQVVTIVDCTRAGNGTKITVINYGAYQDASEDEGSVRAVSGQCEGSVRAPIEELRREIQQSTSPSASSFLEIQEVTDTRAFAKTANGVSHAPASSKKASHTKRTTDQIRRALGDERLKWWAATWKIYPCHEDMNRAMDAYERRVHDHETAEQIYRGAQRYAAKAQADPTMKLKYMQGWINTERWTDEIIIPKPPKSSMDQFKEAFEERMREHAARQVQR